MHHTIVMYRLETAKQLGATHTFLSKRDGDPKELAAAIAQVVRNQGGLDYAVDTTGSTHLCVHDNKLAAMMHDQRSAIGALSP